MNPFQRADKATRNVPLADQLADIRDMIKDLQKDEKEIVDKIREAGGDKGAYYEAVINRVTSKRLDTKLAREMLGDRAGACEKEVVANRVELKKIDETSL